MVQGDDKSDRGGSAPCFMHELDPVQRGYLSTEETAALLNVLLEAERAGAQVTRAMAREAPDEKIAAALKDVSRDEADFCAMLTRHIRALGARPTKTVGSFREKVLEADSLSRQLDLLDRGQRWVVRKLEEALPRIHDDDLHADLHRMKAVHEENVDRCAHLTDNR